MPVNPQEEAARLEAVAADSWYGRGANAASARYAAAIFARHWRGRRCLELGPAEGEMSETLVQRFDDVTLVDGSAQFVDGLRRRFPRAAVVCSLFEDFRPAAPFDTIILGHVLEHVVDPAAILARCKEWLAPGGVVCACVPNARSLHRQAGVILGLLPHEHALNEADVHHGHRRVYDPETFRADFRAAGLKIAIFGGYWLKPLSNAQLEAQWTPEQLDAFMVLGERYPDVACEIYVIAGG
jgi:2-polyprenyl-3-methyl-5-hydroxy-6-metoxy-1,4-benzoquinol methylase